MARTELITRRGKNFKTFLNDDKTVTIEIGPHAHYQKNDIWEETDCTIYEEAVEKTDAESGQKYKYGTHNHPMVIRMNNSRQPLIVDQVVYIPQGRVNMVIPTKTTDNTYFYPQMWDGIDVNRIVIPEGLVEELIITSSAGQKEISWRVQGNLENSNLAPFNPQWILWENINEKTEMLDSGLVPFTFENNLLIFDLSGIPVGAVIQ